MVHIVEPSPAVVQPLAQGLHEVVTLVVLLEKVPIGHGSQCPLVPVGLYLPGPHTEGSGQYVSTHTPSHPYGYIRQNSPSGVFVHRASQNPLLQFEWLDEHG